MAHKVTLFDEWGDKVLDFRNVIVDIVRTHTVIHKKHEIINLPLTVCSIITIGSRTNVFYDNDYSLSIQSNFYKC